MAIFKPTFNPHRPQPFEDYYVDPVFGRIGKGKMSTHLSKLEALEFRQVMHDAGWVEYRQYGGPHHKEVYYKSKYNGEQIYRDELLQKSPHGFSSFIYESKMDYEAKKSQMESGFVEQMCYDAAVNKYPSSFRNYGRREQKVVTAMEPLREGQAVSYSESPQAERSPLVETYEQWAKGQSSWNREPKTYLRQRVDKWLKP